MLWNSTDMYGTREGSRGGPGMDSQQQFCLKWNSFGSNLATAFSNLWKSESLADVTLFCGGRHFKAHRLILAACSKHFQELFKSAPPSHVGSCYVILEATTAENMQALLEFMYKGEVHVSSDALPSFLKSAESLQVKGLSIEHEKLAYAQSFGDRHTPMKPSPTGGAAVGGCEAADSALPPQGGAASFAPILAPYPLHLHGGGVAGAGPPLHSGRYPLPTAHIPHPNAHRRPAPLKPSPSPSPHARNYRPSSSSSHCDEPDTRSSPGGGVGHGGRYDDNPDCPATPTTTTGHKSGGYERSASADDMLERRLSNDQGAEDLRVKMETDYHGGYSAPPTPTAAIMSSTYQDKPPETSSTPPAPGPDKWTKTLASSKSGGIATADGKKLKCPYCERLYGYETNLRAHIRQRHQGIRVPCPHCSRTFTRNNTVRRHIAREHKHEAELKAHFPPGAGAALHNHAQ